MEISNLTTLHQYYYFTILEVNKFNFRKNNKLSI